MLLKNLLLLIIIPFGIILPQLTFEPVNSDVYNFLESLHFKGIISFNQQVKPLSRISSAELLLQADKAKSKLTDVEATMLERFLIEFEPEINKINEKNSEGKKFLLSGKRLRLFEYYDKYFSIYADPVLSAETGFYNDKSLIIRRNGLTLGGYILNNWSYSVRFFDNEETGDNLDKTKYLTRDNSVTIIKEKNNSFEYDQVTANVEYRWSNGAVSINKDYLSFGSGCIGKIILSDKAPPFTFIRFDFYPAEWLSFFYFHGFLQSNVPDSSTFRYNTVPGRTSILEVPKYFAFHSLTFTPTDEIQISIGESIVYSERIQPIYFIPVMFFRVADHYLGTGNASATGNAQMFADFYYLKKSLGTKFYSSLFIDELSLNSLFKGENLSAIGFTLGVETRSILPESKIFIEYTRINPFVYMNSVEAQLYSNDGFKMGHWIESNGDIVAAGLKKYFTGNLSSELNVWYFRKGKTEDPAEQYSSPYPDFLYGSRRIETGAELLINYSPIVPVNIQLKYQYTNITDKEAGRTYNFKVGKKQSILIKLSYQM